MIALINPEAVSNPSRDAVESDWRTWIAQNFPEYLWPPFAPYHAEFWEWVWSIQQGEPVRPFVAVWARGHAKSTSIEVACAMMAARRTRTYGLYVSETQSQADDHLGNVAAMLEVPTFETHYPDAASRKVGKFGNSKGWRRNRIRTASGFTLDAIGLDTAARGIKVEEHRPNLIIFDDVDNLHDSPGAVDRKIRTITQSLLPARAKNTAVLVCQNLIHEAGIVAKLADGSADFLTDRIVSGPHPAIDGMVVEREPDGGYRITEGTPTWPAMSIESLQSELNEMGLTAFRREKQHEVGLVEGSMFGHLDFDAPGMRIAWDDLPELERVAVWVDPAVTDKDKSDAHGINADALGVDGRVYRLYSWEQRTSPLDALQRAILKAVELGALEVGVETDQGGDTWQSVFREAVDTLVSEGRITRDQAPGFKDAKAGAGHGPKAQRAAQMLTAYEQGRFVHVIGTHDVLERGLKRYLVRKPYDVVDSAYWSSWDLLNEAPPAALPVVSRVVRDGRIGRPGGRRW